MSAPTVAMNGRIEGEARRRNSIEAMKFFSPKGAQASKCGHPLARILEGAVRA